MRDTQAAPSSEQRADGAAEPSAAASVRSARRAGRARCAALSGHAAASGQRRALAGALGNAALPPGPRAAIMRVPDPNEPERATPTSSRTSAGVTVMSEEGARLRWAEAHPEPGPRGAGDRVDLPDRPLPPAAASRSPTRRRGPSWGNDAVRVRHGRRQLDGAHPPQRPAAAARAQATVDQINDPSTAPAVIRAGLEKLQADAREVRGATSGPTTTSTFPRAIIGRRCARDRRTPMRPWTWSTRPSGWRSSRRCWRSGTLRGDRALRR